MNNGKRVAIQISGITSPNGYIDLYEDEPISITYAIADVTDLTSKGGASSQSFVVPGSPNNNKLFTDIFNIGVNGGFNPNQLTPVFMTVDSIPVLNGGWGSLQITGINVERDTGQFVDYEVTVYDSLKNFQANIGSNLINTLPWNDLNHTYSLPDITGSFYNTENYCYPLIDYGYDFTYAQLTSNPGVVVASGQSQMYPAVFVSTLLERIFQSNNYTLNITDPNFETILNRCIIPFNGNPQTFNTYDFANINSFEAGLSGFMSLGIDYFGNYTGINNNMAPRVYSNCFTQYPLNANAGYPGFYQGGIEGFAAIIPFNGEIIYDPGNHYSEGSTVPYYYQYSASTNSIQNFNYSFIVKINIAATDTSQLAPEGPQPITFILGLLQNGLQITQTSLQINPQVDANLNNVGFSYGTDLFYNISGSFDAWPVSATSTYQMFIKNINFYYLTTANRNSIAYEFQIMPTSIYGDSVWYNNVSSQLVPGQEIYFSGAVPQQVKQIDVLTSLQNMFNLYFEPDPYMTNQINVAPRDTYFSSGLTIDWTAKWDSSQPVQEVLLSEQQLNRFILNYKDDTDWANQNYKNLTNLTYGEGIYYMPNTYTVGDNETDLIFSPTPVAPVFGTVGTDYLIPKIIPYYAVGSYSSAAGFTSSNIRILQYQMRNLPQGEYWNLNGTSFTAYPYAGMMEDPISGTTDLSFSSTTFEYYDTPSSGTTQNNLLNLFWLNYLNQIADPSSKMITAQFWLTPSDITNFRYNNQIFVKGLTNESGYYYTVNSVTWDAVHPHVPATVELVKLPYPFFNINYNGTLLVNKNKMTKAVGWSQAATSFTLGGLNNLSTRSIVSGIGSSILSNSDSSVAFGDGHIVSQGSAQSTVHGTNGFIGSGNVANTVRGNNASIL